jgi:hypothetical protein
MTDTATLLDLLSTPDTMVSQLFMALGFQANKPWQEKNRSGLPFSKRAEKASSHKVGQLPNNISHPAKVSLDTFLRNTEVRLCFGEVDHILMNLEGCNTMTDLCIKVRLYLQEEIVEKQILGIDVTREDNQELVMGKMKLRRLRLLPGPGREDTYNRFLHIRSSAPLEDESCSFIMSVDVEGD